ncbi:hypothetical protein [Cellulomonas cellasea]|nr:hypothetical protein [Cellulomonas cellasea]GEA87166.1 hypothetical protein CCE01nite_11150 [Cellulomonas cellasea]
MRARWSGAWAVGVALVAGVGLGPAAAGAGPSPGDGTPTPAVTASPPPVDEVRCGDTLTGEHRLTGDLVCDGVGLTLAGSVTLDLAGHTLDGGGSGVAFLRVEDDSEDDEAAATVLDGVVRGWDYGFRERAGGIGPPGNHADGVTFEDVGVVFRDENATILGMDVSLRDSVVTGADVVFSLGYPARALSEGTRFERNELLIGGADGGFEFRDCVMVDNRLFATISDIGFLTLLDSEVRGSDEVVSPYWSGATLIGNTFVDNDVVVAASGAGRQVHGNTFAGNGLAVGAGMRWWIGWGDGPNVVVDNVFRGNHDAIVSEPGADLHLGDNVVTGSTGWGIYAPGAVDLGGNRAWGNAREPQCTGVVCLGRRS